MKADDQPVIAGVGLVSQREVDPALAREPLALMVEAARQAGEDTGSAILSEVTSVMVPKGRWRYGDPGRTVAKAVGAPDASTVLAKVGVLQQTLIGQACAAVAAGEDKAVLVVGGEAGHRLLMARMSGVELRDTVDEGEPGTVLKAERELVAPAELDAGLKMPVGFYALIESALAAARGESADETRRRISALYSRFSRVAAGNPHAWHRTALSEEEIGTPGTKNRMQAAPYTSAHCADWNVDQASALLITTAGRAREFGIAAEKLIHALASTECNHMQPVSSRPLMHRSPGAAQAGAAALEAAGLAIGEIDLVELYSCFPCAVEIVAAELNIDPAVTPTVTGGMAFAGGPFNNYVLHATAQMAQQLRAGRGETGLVGSLSGILTKPGFGIWSRRAPRQAFAFRDVTDAVEREAVERPVTQGYRGPGTVAAWTVVHSRDAAPLGIAVIDSLDGMRTVAACDPAALDGENTMVGRSVDVDGNRFTAGTRS